MIFGDAGVGKSRLLATIADRADTLGWSVTRVAGSRSLTGVPFGAYAAVLGESVSKGGGDLFSILQGALAELQADDRPVLLTIDDAHQLDDGGAALAALAARSGLVVMASVRRGEPCPEAVTALWKDDLAARLDLTPLVGDGVGEVMLAALGAPVDSGTRRRLADKTGGNLLFLRELVRVGLARGTLVERGGVWMWDGPINDAPAVADLVRTRLAGLSEAERRVVDVVALAEPIGLALLDSLSDPAAVRECEAKGILVTERGGRRLEARLEHPLYADVVRDAMRPTTSTQLAKDVAEALLATGANRVGDRLRAAALLLMASAPADLDLLLGASAEARSLADFELSERFGRAAVELHGGAAATVDLASTLHWRGHHREVVALLSSGVLDGAAEDDAGRGAMFAAQALFFGLGDLDAAERWIARGAETGGATWGALLRGKHSQMLMNAGRTREAIAEGRAVLADRTARPVARIAAYSGLLPALAVAGRLSELGEHLPLAQQLVTDVPDGFTDNADGTLVGMFIGGLFDGRLPEIDPILDAFDDAALRRVDDPFRCIWVFLRGRSALAQGRLGIALPTLREAAAVLRRRDPGGMLGWCLASLAQACGATGDARGARAAVAEFDEVHPAVMRNIDAEIGLGRAWAEAAAGKRTEAVAGALATAEAIVDRGDAAVGVFVLHDALRLGASPRLVTSLMATPRSEAEGPVVAAMAAHALAMANADLDGLRLVSDALASVSMPLLAAEACAAASASRRRTAFGRGSVRRRPEPPSCWRAAVLRSRRCSRRSWGVKHSPPSLGGSRRSRSWRRAARPSVR